jgi:hypothetical protein
VVINFVRALTRRIRAVPWQDKAQVVHSADGAPGSLPPQQSSSPRSISGSPG